LGIFYSLLIAKLGSRTDAKASTFVILPFQQVFRHFQNKPLRIGGQLLKSLQKLFFLSLLGAEHFAFPCPQPALVNGISGAYQFYVLFGESHSIQLYQGYSSLRQAN
jgi:hypothetical protein